MSSLQSTPQPLPQDVVFSPAQMHQLRDLFGEFERKIDKKIDVKFATLDTRFITLEKRMDFLEKRMASLERRFEALEKRFYSLEKRFDLFEQRFSAFEKKTQDQFNTFATWVDLRFTTFERTMDERFNMCLTTAQFEAYRYKHERILSKYAADVQATLNRIETTLLTHDRHIKELQRVTAIGVNDRGGGYKI